MIEKHWKFEQVAESTTWNVNNVPEGADGAHITHIKTNDGRILRDFGQVVSPDGLQLSFGVEAESGVAYGTYYIDGETDTVIDQAGNVVNITMNSGLRT